jgi:hypothetical protein
MNPIHASISLTACIYSPLTAIRPMRLNLRLPEGLNEYTPQKLAGILTDPAESEASPNALLRVLTRAH